MSQQNIMAESGKAKMCWPRCKAEGFPLARTAKQLVLVVGSTVGRMSYVALLPVTTHLVGHEADRPVP